MRHVWTIICQRSITDEQSSNVSFVDVLEQVTLDPESLKTVMEHEGEVGQIALPVRVCSLWHRDDAAEQQSFRFRHSILGPDGSQLATHENSLAFDAGIRRVKVIVQLEKWPIAGLGDHWIVTESAYPDTEGWIECSRTPIEVLGIEESASD